MEQISLLVLMDKVCVEQLCTCVSGPSVAAVMPDGAAESLDREHSPQSLKCELTGPLQKSFTNPCLA